MESLEARLAESQVQKADMQAKLDEAQAQLVQLLLQSSHAGGQGSKLT